MADDLFEDPPPMDERRTCVHRGGDRPEPRNGFAARPPRRNEQAAADASAHMSDPDDLAAAELVIALREAIPRGVTVTREHGGYRVRSADGECSIVVFDDGSTSELSLTRQERSPVDELTALPRAGFWDPSLLRSARLHGER
jgi:hypothetical protein